jgi:hypothetical protein
MAKKKFGIDQEHGFIGETKSKAKPKPFTESPIITEYIQLRDSFDWTPEPPKYTGEPVDILEIAKEVFNWDMPEAKVNILTEAEDKQKKRSTELHLQTKICNWINNTWPGLIFVSDFAAGLFLPPNIASVRKEQACIDKYPDLTICNPRGNYFGLCVEIKTEQGTPYLKDGKTLKSSEHIQAQNKTLEKLRSLGYCACFGVGEDQIKRIIAKYMGFETTKIVR